MKFCLGITWIYICKARAQNRVVQKNPGSSTIVPVTIKRDWYQTKGPPVQSSVAQGFSVFCATICCFFKNVFEEQLYNTWTEEIRIEEAIKYRNPCK